MATQQTKVKSKERKIQLTPSEQEKLEVLKKVKEYKNTCEANVVSIIYKYPDLIRECKLTIEDFHDECWKVYFEIAHEIIIVEKKNTLDHITCFTHLEKHPKLFAKFKEYGGYDLIVRANTFMQEENFEGYLAEFKKWNAVFKMVQKGFIVDKNKLSEFCDMSAEKIYKLYEVALNDIFANIDNDIKGYDIADGLDELIDELDKGMAVGLPYYDMPLLSAQTGGQYDGSITLVGGLSNVGKSTFARTTTIPSIIERKQKIVCFLNEDSLKKWQRELLVYVANNIDKFDLQKHTVRDGHYTTETREALQRAANWIKEQTKNNIITVFPFQRYETGKVIKLINKYAQMGVKYFLLDTYKMDAGKVSETSCLDMQQKMVDINDCIKAEANNVHILITFQLSKGSARQRYYTQDNIGVAKNIIDPASTCIMIRNLYDDEYSDGKNPLKAYKFGGKKGKTQIPITLTRDKHYQIVFVVKNREGAANQKQILIEHDMSRNCMKEIGICEVPFEDK